MAAKILQNLAQLPRLRWRLAAAVFAAAGLASALPACVQEAAQPMAVEAERLYADGLEHLAGGSVLEAEQDLQKVAKLPAYVGLTSLARLRLADALFVARRYDEAIEAYHAFITRHEGNPNVAYATFMVARSQFELAPTDLWIMPPAYELDLGPVNRARTELEKFVRTYPRSRYATEALLLRDRCIELQYAHTQYVVAFYANRGEWMGVVFRLHQAMQNYPSRAHTLEYYTLLARGYAGLNWRTRAVELWQAIARRWPQSPQAQGAPAEIASLQRAIAEAKAKGEPAEMPVLVPPTAAVKPETLDNEGSS